MIIFTPYSVDEEGDAWTCSDPGVEEVAEDLLNLGAEAGLLGGPGVLVTTAGEEGEVPRRGNVVSSVAPSSVTQPATVMTGAKDVPSSPRLRGPSLSPLQTSKLSASPSSTRPLTLSDVASTLQRQQEQEQVEALGVEGRRSQFAGLREKQASFQSELSGLSLQSKSSIDSLLESREADPVDVLLSLGFGGQAQDTVTRIPERFLRPSQVPGNNIEDFLKSEDEFSDMMESAEWMPGLDPQALRRSSVATVSPLMLRLLDTIRESRSRHHQSSVSEDTSSAGHTPAAATPPSGVSKFAAVAKSLALKNSVMQTLSSGRPNKLSVLNAENRRLLDLQGQKSPEVPRKRLIIGQSSFDLGRDGELIANEDEGMGISVDQEEDDEDEDEDEEDEGDGIGDKEEGDANSEDGRERIAEGDEQEEGSWRRHGLLQHKDSVWSMASSATSIDSSEEEIREQRHRLQLSLSRRPLQPDPATLTPTTPADSLDSPQPVFSTSGADSSDRYRKIMRRLSCNKRHSTISSSGSWEMDERIPEEDLEDDVNHEPLHDQVICEADASGSLNSCSDTRASVISGSPHQRHSSSLSPEGQGSSRVQGSSPSPPVSVSNKKRQGDSSSSQNGPDSSMPLLSFSQHSHNPALIHPVPILLQHSPGPAPLPRTSRIGEEASPCLTQRGSGGVLRRQQRVDDGYADTGGRQTLQPPNLHSQHCRHQHSSGHQGRGPGNDEDRSAPTGLLCRSGSAQSDSSGFMDGDVVEAETRTPTQQNLSSVQLSTSPQAHTDMLLVALHTYRHQLVHQEHLSRQLHDTAMDIPSPSVNTQHLSQQLRNISAIRAAIRAEVTHMEQLMASTQHTALSPACINNVITQMVMLLQQQSELCRDLETLTVASSCTSQEGASHSTQHLSQESSFDNLPEKPNPLCQSSNPPDLIHHDTDPSPKLGNSVHETFGNHIVHDSAAWKSSEQGQGFLNFDSNLGTANHVRNDSSCANHSIEKLVFSDHSTVKTISSKHSQEKAIISGYSEQCTNIPDQKSDSERKTDWFQEPQEVIHRSIGNVELNNNSIDSCLRLEELNPDGSADHSQLASYKSTRSPFNPWNSAQGKQQGLAKTFDRHQEEALEGGTDMATFLGSGDVSSDTSSLASQVAQLVQQQVQIQTQVLEEQLHQQTKDMADIKSMMEILINKMS
ncbi:uncharacterized protein LOC125033963 isoform X3 [Penaeus chinensis]|uniref:uncharacterized protein LOC125033963 isoform X3 n=1 Tax=Penaeus chinensis TaxID=139456 RepID=UPI001FB69925|nr:uncharacterized protein LOC125033963 isoform X3 [Penaeus chinensis]